MTSVIRPGCVVLLAMEYVVRVQGLVLPIA